MGGIIQNQVTKWGKKTLGRCAENLYPKTFNPQTNSYLFISLSYLKGEYDHLTCPSSPFYGN